MVLCEKFQKKEDPISIRKRCSEIKVHRVFLSALSLAMYLRETLEMTMQIQ